MSDSLHVYAPVRDKGRIINQNEPQHLLRQYDLACIVHADVGGDLAMGKATAA